jgi:hypothetical protein
MDVFEAVNSRIACRHFLDKPVDLNIVRKLIGRSARSIKQQFAALDRLDRNPDKMRVRLQTVEHPFGTIKAWMGATHFQMTHSRHAVLLIGEQSHSLAALLGAPKARPAPVQSALDVLLPTRNRLESWANPNRSTPVRQALFGFSMSRSTSKNISRSLAPTGLVGAGHTQEFSIRWTQHPRQASGAPRLTRSSDCLRFSVVPSQANECATSCGRS